MPELPAARVTSRNASSIESALDQSGRSLEHLEDGLARLRVCRHPWFDHDRARTQPARLPDAHRRAYTECLRLVAGGEDDAAADDHRPAAQPRVVSLLNRGEEGIEIGVEDRSLARHEHMFAGMLLRRNGLLRVGLDHAAQVTGPSAGRSNCGKRANQHGARIASPPLFCLLLDLEPVW